LNLLFRPRLSAFQPFNFSASRFPLSAFRISAFLFSFSQNQGRAAASRRAADDGDESEKLKFCQRNAHVQFLFSISAFQHFSFYS
jgi:hypothetical protein